MYDVQIKQKQSVVKRLTRDGFAKGMATGGAGGGEGGGHCGCDSPAGSGHAGVLRMLCF